MKRFQTETNLKAAQTESAETPKILTISEPTPRQLSLEDAYNMIGGFGRYQVIFSLSASISFITSMMYLFTIPLFSVFPKVTGCQVSDSNDTLCATAEDACVYNVTYEYSDKQFNYITEFDLLCDDLSTSMISIAYMIGSLTGVFVMGFISDNHGRLKTITIGHTGMVIGLLLLTQIRGLTACVYISACCGFFASGCSTPGYTFAYESSSLDTAKYYGTIVNISYGVGELIIALLMWTGIEWRTMCYLIMIWAATFFIMRSLIVEPARYLSSKGLFSAAIKSLRYMAGMNAKELPSRFELAPPENENEQAPKFKDVLRLLFTKTTLYRLILCMGLFFTVSFTFYGISMNIQGYQGSVYLNAVLNGIVEILAYLIGGCLMQIVGKKQILSTSYIIAGTGLLVQGFANLGETESTVCLMLAKFGISSCYNFIYLMVGELFPPAVKNTIFAICTATDNVGSIVGIFLGKNIILFNVVAGILCGGCVLIVALLPSDAMQKVLSAENVQQHPGVNDPKINPVQNLTP